ncbi:MAG: hypothetical protein ACKV2T_17740 [Kofleriaceae bacterium]
MPDAPVVDSAALADAPSSAGCNVPVIVTPTTSPSGYGPEPAIAADPSGVVNILYYDSIEGDLRNARRSPNGTWTVEVVDSVGGNPGGIVSDPSGGLHASYVWQQTLRYAYRPPGGAWTATEIFGVYAGSDSDIARGPSGELHIGYRGQDLKSLRFAHRAATANFHDWTDHIVESQGAFVGDNSITLDAQGLPHISYADLSTNDLKVADPTLAGWQRTTVDATSQVYFGTSAVFDGQGGMNVVYFDGTNGDLKYAYRATAGSAWTTTTIDAVGRTGLYPQIARDSSGGLHVSYMRTDTQMLRYAVWPPGGTWSTADVAPVGPEAWGSQTAIAIDPYGRAHLAAYDAVNRSLLYMFRCP